MYTRGVITDEISQDIDRVIAVMKRFNVVGAEIRTIGETRVDRLTPRQVGEIKRRLDDEGMMVPALATPFLKCDLGNGDEYREHLEILRRSIEVAKALDTTLLRVFTFWRKEPLEDWGPIVDAYTTPIELATRAGMTLGVENEPSCYVGTGAELGRFLDLTNSPAVRGIWDPGNAVAEPGFPDGYERVRGRCPHVHLKDQKILADGSAVSVAIGDGDVDLRGQLLAWRRDGYEGCVSLETHWRPQQLSSDVLNRPGGGHFSAFVEEATTICFERWDELEQDLDRGAATGA